MPYADITQYREYQREYRRRWRAENPEAARAEWRKSHERLKEKRLAFARAYKKANRPAMTALQVRRHASQMQRTPKWADLAAIEAVYVERARIAAETGIPHEVDHVFPLQGKSVSGLHVAANLRVITQRENRSKGNRVV